MDHKLEVHYNYSLPGQHLRSLRFVKHLKIIKLKPVTNNGFSEPLRPQGRLRTCFES